MLASWENVRKALRAFQGCPVSSTSELTFVYLCTDEHARVKQNTFQLMQKYAKKMTQSLFTKIDLFFFSTIRLNHHLYFF